MKLSGVLLNDSAGSFYFRVYNKDGEFDDIDLYADDISITIDDPNLTIRKNENGNMYIDYNNDVLGYDEPTNELTPMELDKLKNGSKL